MNEHEGWDFSEGGRDHLRQQQEAAEARKSENRLKKEVYKMYGEYLANIRKPYPEHLVPRGK